jgi:hypothetical protein
MYPAERTLLRYVRQTLYMLKRQYGGQIDIYRLVNSGTDPKTGDVLSEKEVIRVRRAVVLPVRISREVRRSISQISANKKFVTGGTYDAGRRLFIVDRADVSDLQLTNDDYLVYRNRKYEIGDFQAFEFDAGWIITGRELVGEVPEQIHLLTVDHLLALESGAEVA